MKTNEIAPRGWHASLTSPLGSANGDKQKPTITSLTNCILTLYDSFNVEIDVNIII